MGRQLWICALTVGVVLVGAGPAVSAAAAAPAKPAVSGVSPVSGLLRAVGFPEDEVVKRRSKSLITAGADHCGWCSAPADRPFCRGALARVRTCRNDRDATAPLALSRLRPVLPGDRAHRAVDLHAGPE